MDHEGIADGEVSALRVRRLDNRQVLRYELDGSRIACHVPPSFEMGRKQVIEYERDDCQRA